MLEQIELRADSHRLDGFKNELTGIGDWRRDRTFGGAPGGSPFELAVLSGNECEARWRGSDLGARIIETIPDEMTREGWKISIQPDEKDDLDAESTEFDDRRRDGVLPDIDDEAPKTIEDLNGITEELRAADAFWQALCYERAYGGGAILLGADDGFEDLSKPLDEERISSVRFLNVFRGGWDGELIAWRYYQDHNKPRYGRPEVYMLRNLGVPAPLSIPGERASLTANRVAPSISFIHESRLLVFGGITTSTQTRISNRGWGDSLFMRVDKVLRDFDLTWSGIAVMMSEFSQGVISIEGLSEKMLSKRATASLAQRALGFQLARSIARILVIDAKEKFSRDTVAVSGVAEVLQQFMLRLAAAADMPVALLMGQAPAGLNATGASDIRFFYDRVAARQKKRLQPQLRRLLKLIMLSQEGPTGAKEIERWSVDFKSLYQMTELETATLRKTVADTDAVNITSGVITPEEVAASAYGGSEWTMERTIDLKGRREMAAIQPAPGMPGMQPPPGQPPGPGEPPGGAPLPDDGIDLSKPIVGNPGTFDRMDEWNEEAHKRAPKGSAGGGQFGSGGGASTGEEEKKKGSKEKGAAKEKTAKPASKKSAAGEARKADVLAKSTPAPDVPHYHGTAISNLESILKTGIKPTSKDFGEIAKSAWAAPDPTLAHVYASGATAERGDDHYAMIVLKSGKAADLHSFQGNKSASFTFNTIKPEHIDHVEIYKVGGKEPVTTMRRGADGNFGAVPSFKKDELNEEDDGLYAAFQIEVDAYYEAMLACEVEHLDADEAGFDTWHTDEWNEEQHPRDKDGKFGQGGGGGDHPPSGMSTEQRTAWYKSRTKEVKNERLEIRKARLSLPPNASAAVDLPPPESGVTHEALTTPPAGAGADWYKAQTAKLKAERLKIKEARLALQPKKESKPSAKKETATAGPPPGLSHEARMRWYKESIAAVRSERESLKKQRKALRSKGDAWNEEDHPRAPNGEFGQGGGGKSASSGGPDHSAGGGGGKGKMTSQTPTAHVIDRIKVKTIIDDNDQEHTIISKLPKTHTPEEHIEIAKAYIAKHEAGYEKTKAEVEGLIIPGSEFSGRVKEIDSALGKVALKSGSYPTADKLQDATGMRVINGTIAEVKQNVERIRGKFTIVSEDNYIDHPNPKNPLYRSHHLTIRGDDGLDKELQIRTQGQHDYAEWAHNVYKPITGEQKAAMLDPPVKAAALRYAEAMSNHIYQKDLGHPVGPEPVVPREVDAVFGRVGAPKGH